MQPKTRTLLIIAALAAPLVALAVAGHYARPGNKPANHSATPPALSTSPAAEAALSLPVYNTPPDSLDEALRRTRERLAVLEKMTPEDWKQDQEKKARDRKAAAWERLPPEEKLKQMGMPRREPRLPDLAPAGSDVQKSQEKK